MDHDAAQHDDLAIALALGTHYLLDTDPEPVLFLDPATDGGRQACTRNALGVEVLQQRGIFAYRLDPADEWLEASTGSDEGDITRRIVRTVRESPLT